MAATNKLIEEVNSSSLSEDAKYNVLHELKVKQGQFNNALALALGLSIDANITQEHPPTGPFARFFGDRPTFQVAIPGQQFPVLVRVVDSGSVPVAIDSVSLELAGDNGSSIHAEGDTSGTLKGESVLSARFDVHLSDDAGYTRPYFERPGLEQPYYDVREAKYRNLPSSPYPLRARATASFHGVQIQLAEVVQTVERDPGEGTILHPMPIGPAISVVMTQSDAVVPLNAPSIPVSVKIHSNVKGPAQGNVRLDLPAGWKSNPASAHFFLRAGQPGADRYLQGDSRKSEGAEISDSSYRELWRSRI